MMKFPKTVLFIILFFVFNAEAQYKTFETDSGILAYETFGDGTPVLIINGGPGMNSNGFSTLAKLLSTNNKVIIYDQRGTGKSQIENADDSSFTMDLMVQDIESLRQELGYENWIIFGHSFGGMLAYAYTAKHPERVKAMIQSHSGGMNLRNMSRFTTRNGLTEAENDSLIHYSTMMEINPGNPHLSEKRALFLAKAYLVGSEHEEAIAERLQQVNRDLNFQVWANMRENNFDTTTEMKNFKKKVLITHGLQDIVPVEVSEFAHQILPDSKLVKIDNCGHYGWLDQPEIYLGEVKKFLKAHSSITRP